jgi:hypothetical protein
MLLRWNAKFAINYEILVSKDSLNWSSVYTEKVSDGGYDKILFSPVNAQYIKVNCIKSGTNSGFSIANIEAYSDRSSNQPPYLKAHTTDKIAVTGTMLKVSFYSAFADDDLGERLFYSFALTNGGKFPTWLAFNDTTKTLQGTPSIGDTGIYNITITVKDLAGAQAQDAFSIKVGNATLIQKLYGQNRLMVYPNPCSNLLNIVLPSTNSSNTKITIYNMLGAIILEQKFDRESKMEINCKSFYPGNYLVKVVNGTSVYYSKINKY